jgi:ergothioneine biosynthesis protein EgtB
MRAGGWNAPLYWMPNTMQETGGVWRHFTLTGVCELESSEPVCHVSFYEADAYARWAGARLATEFEWEIAARHAGACELPPEGMTAPEAAQAAYRGASNGHSEVRTFQRKSHDPSKMLRQSEMQNSGETVDRSFPNGTLLEDERLLPAAACGEPGQLQQMFGDCWEWTMSPYTAYPGFRPREGALGEYNGKFMCNQMVLRGGSCATPRSHIRSTYRNFFPPHARWQFSGIRLAR